MADTQNLNTISNDQYGFLEAFKNLSEEYFSLAPDNTKLGLFGYINEITAHVAKTGMFHRNMLYNEFSLNTASLPSTIYSTAIDESVDISLAEPAKATVIVDIPKSQIEDAIETSKVGYIVLNRESFVVHFDNDEFRIPFSLVINRETNGIKCRYLSTNLTFGYTTLQAEENFSGVFDELISFPLVPMKTAYNPEDSTEYLTFKVTVYESSLKVDEQTIYTASTNNTSQFLIDYPNQLVGFKVFYKENNAETWTCLKLFQSTLTLQASSQPYCLYKYVDNDTYQILFDLTSSTFRPTDGSAIKILTMTTKGSQSNYTFTGNLTVDTGLNLDANAVVFVNPTGGRDRPSLMDIKRKIFNARNKVDHLSSAGDLNAHFSAISQEFNDRSKVLIKKTRDDVLLREYTGYMMISDESGNPYPSNTLKSINIANLPDRTIHVYDPIGFYHNPDTDTDYPRVFTRDTIENIQQYLFERNCFLYFSPFTIKFTKIDDEDYAKVMVYNEHINDTIPLYYSGIATGGLDAPSISHMTSYRNPAVNEELKLRIPITEADNTNFEFLLSIKDTSGNCQYLIAMTKITEDSVAYAELIPILGEIGLTDVSSAESEITIATDWDNTRVIYCHTGDYSDDQLYRIRLPAEVDFDIVVLERTDTQVGIVNDTETFGDLANIISSMMSVMRIKSVLSSKSKLMLFDNLTEIFGCKVIEEVPDEDWLSPRILLKYVPVAGAMILFDKDYYDSYVRQLRGYTYELRNTIRRLTNSTSLYIKFFNTYGYNDQWDIIFKTAEGGTSRQNIDQSNLYVELEVEREAGFDETVDAEIKKIVRDFCNNLNSLIENAQVINFRVSLSTLTTQIEKSIPSIVSCNVTKLNGVSNPRFIALKDPEHNFNDPNGSPTVIPSFLALDTKRTIDTIVSPNAVDVDIEWVS